MRRPTVRLVSLLALATLLVPPAAASGESLGITPAELDVASAQRGETYVREVTLQNQFDTPSRFTIEREGETGQWARVEPAGETIDVPPRTNERLRIIVTVPEEAANGDYEGTLRFVGAAKEKPDGSGFALRYAVAVPLLVEVGGVQDARLRFLDASARDVEVGTPPLVLVGVVNEGNVRGDARANVVVLDESGAEVAQASNATRVRPGERGEIRIALPPTLPQGTYRVVVTPDGAPALGEASFKVVAIGTLGKEGILRFLQHDTSAQVGLPVRVTGVFENTGVSTIARARLVGEVWQADRLVAVLASEELTVLPGDTAELVAYFTSAAPGEHRLVAHVVFDGFRSVPNEGVLVATDPASVEQDAGTPWLLIGSIAAVALLGAAAALVARRKRRS